MNDVEAALRSLVAALERSSTRFALVGGLAVSIRTEPRLTRDVDVAVAVADDEEAERVVRGLRSDGLIPAATLEHAATGRLASVRLERAGSGIVADLLFASSGIEVEIVHAAEVLEVLPGLNVGVAQPGHLVALKLLSRAVDRPQDEADLRALLFGASNADIDFAREAVAMIETRGYSRGRELSRDLRELIGR